VYDIIKIVHKKTMNKLTSALTKKPIDFDMAVSVLCESEGLSREQSKRTIDQFVPVLEHLTNELHRAISRMDNTNKITDTKLAAYFMSDPLILEDFDVEIIDKKWAVTYQGYSDSVTITEAYNQLTKKLLNVFGFKELNFQTISNAIIKAYHWNRPNEDGDTEIVVTEATIIETAINFERLFTIPQLKKELPSLRLDTRDIETLLIKYGWLIKQYGKSRVKYFYRNN
jgi:hypothetical protein